MSLSRHVWIALLLLAACSTASWDKPGATKESIQADGEDCYEKARVNARTTTSSSSDGVLIGAPVDRPVGRAGQQDANFQQCMRDRGYSEKQ